VSLVEDIEYLDILSFESNDTGIYHRLSESPMLTVCIGAKCSDGIALIADRKYTNVWERKSSSKKYLVT
jgi:20S proteasome alpha/beta subunit